MHIVVNDINDLFLSCFTTFLRRVVPSGAQDIGTWLVILQLTAVIAVVTNAGIICFTMDLLTFSGVGTIWIFVGFQYFILIFMGLFAMLVDDVPPEVVIQLERQKYLAERALMTTDERLEEDGKTGHSRPTLQSIDFAQFQVRLHYTILFNHLIILYLFIA
jgi:hypothetical protein